ncbi:MAG: YerC/YecD family TrpR-related protein [Candidatus Woesebacteria bacterium]|nr:YerC/YecD family TrpR-related protein [Candidatus Woesebacteria bacterium]
MNKPNIQKDKQLLLDALNKAKKARELPDFVDDLFTEEEIFDLAQRLKIAKLIIAGKTYDEIAEKVNTSTSTVSKIGQILKFGKGGLAKVFSKPK